MRRHKSQRAQAPQSTLTTALQRHGIRGIAIAAVVLMTGTMPAVASPAPSPEAVQSTPTAPGPEASMSPSPVAPSPAPFPAEFPAPDTASSAVAPKDGTNPPAPDVGPFGAYLGQGLSKISAGLDPQTEISPEELNMRSSGSAATGPVSEGSAATAPSTWRPPGVQGMDVSAWQGAVDWSGQWSMGARFAYVKATEGTFYKNPQFAGQYSGSASVGMVRGAYHFALPNLTSGREQAEYFLANGGGWTADGKTLPPLLDFEYNPYDAATMPSGKGDTCYAMTPSQLIAWVQDFSNTIKARTGRVPMIYTTTNWWNYCLGNTTAFADYPLHIAAFNQTGAGPLPSAWRNYTVWQYSDSGPFAGDSNQWPGTLSALQSFARNNTNTTTAPVSNPPFKSIADLAAVDSAGRLWNYPANGQGGFGTRTQIGSGWYNITSINTVDWNGDGLVDILVQWSSGALSYYPARQSGGFGTPVTLASAGWQNFTISVGPWLQGPSPALIGVRTDGKLFYWPKTSTHALGTAVQIGSGFTGMPIVMADHDRDGLTDVLARTSTGEMKLFRGSGTGPFVSEPRKTVGTGWGSMNTINALDGVDGSGSAGLVARTNDGYLRYYPITGSGFGASRVLGYGWETFLVAGTPFINSTPPTSAEPPAAPPIRSLADIVSVDSAGDLWNYPATGSGSLAARQKIGTGWNGVQSLHTADWNQDGTVDVVAQWTSGRLNVYLGRPDGTFGTGVVLAASGWAGSSITVGKWRNSDAYPGIIARDTAGAVHHYPNPSGAALGSRTQIGARFHSLPVTMADFDGDGAQDIIARDGGGRLLLYRSTGAGTFQPGSPRVVGQGWGNFATLHSVREFSGTGSTSLIAKTNDGRLMNYGFTGGSWQSPSEIGRGWGSMTILGTPLP